MAAKIAVKSRVKGQGWECVVQVSEGGSHTTHIVTVEQAYRDRVVGAVVPIERLVEQSFEFLLAREPKESILRSFSLPVISRYFPEYEQEIRNQLAAARGD